MGKSTFAILGFFAVLLMGFSLVSATQYVETFDNSSATSYGDGSFLGENSVTWSFTESRDEYDYAISGAGLMLRDTTSKITSDTISGGIGTFSVKLKKGYTGAGNRQVELLINGVSKANSTAFDNTATQTFTLNDINTEGDFTIELRNTKGDQIVIDDITWTNYTATTPPTPTGTNFCEFGQNGTLEISDLTINNLGKGDEEEWELLDEIEIEVEIENTHNTEDVKNVIVEIKIMDGNNDVTNDFDFTDEEIDLGRIRDDESEIAVFKINELPADLEDKYYKIFIKAYSEGEESLQCVDSDQNELNNKEYHQIEIVRENDPAVIIKEDDLSKISASCGDNNVMTSFYIYNIGSDKEEKILVVLGNSALGIDERVVVDNLKSGKRKEVTFDFDIPEDLTESSYKLKLATYFDYDKDEDELKLSSYGEDSDEIDENYDFELEILNCKGPSPSITADLESTAKEGEELIIKATITNNGGDNDFIVSASGFESWANLVSVAQTVSIDEDSSAEVLIKLMPTASGTQSFDINAIVDGKTTSQSVSVNIAEGEKKEFFSVISNTMLYTIAGIVALLILIFLVLIVKVSRRSAKPQF